MQLSYQIVWKVCEQSEESLEYSMKWRRSRKFYSPGLKDWNHVKE